MDIKTSLWYINLYSFKPFKCITFVRLCSSLELHDIHLLLTVSFHSKWIPFAFHFEKYSALLRKFSVKCEGIHIMHGQSLWTNVYQIDINRCRHVRPIQGD